MQGKHRQMGKFLALKFFALKFFALKFVIFLFIVGAYWQNMSTLKQIKCVNLLLE